MHKPFNVFVMNSILRYDHKDETFGVSEWNAITTYDAEKNRRHTAKYLKQCGLQKNRGMNPAFSSFWHLLYIRGRGEGMYSYIVIVRLMDVFQQHICAAVGVLPAAAEKVCKVGINLRVGESVVQIRGIVQGQMEKDSGTVESWLTDNKMYVTFSTNYDNGGKYAITHYRTLKRAAEFSLVELKLETGRKNQIRVHARDIGHPIVGDTKYGTGHDPIGRLCLHAYRLHFIHPRTGQNMSFETPFPKEFNRLVTPVVCHTPTIHNANLSDNT